MPFASYLDSGRNPDLYTKHILAGLVRESEIVQGKMRALCHFEELLRGELVAQYPHLKDQLIE